MFAQIHEKTKALNAQIAALRKEAAEMIKPLLSEFIKANPEVKKLAWTQYTPYFNDGESCTFSVNEPEFYFEGDEEDEDGYGEGHSAWCLSKDEYRPAGCSNATAEACSALAKELGALEDALEELFGDHVKVIVTADGVEVDEYSHD